uniref:Secreted protein n=1 Tax=Steinernema glaseri TaxID=37863 RepID=A0A1I7Z5G0_9BILA
MFDPCASYSFTLVLSLQAASLICPTRLSELLALAALLIPLTIGQCSTGLLDSSNASLSADSCEKLKELIRRNPEAFHLLPTKENAQTMRTMLTSTPSQPMPANPARSVDNP